MSAAQSTTSAPWPARPSTTSSSGSAATGSAHPADGAALADPASFTSAQARPLATGARGAVIIPAHDEEEVIGSTLSALSPLGTLPSIEVMVVCNGCADDTASVARSFPWVRVEEMGEASKTAALNHGDRVAVQWPRLYLDADIEIAPAAVLATFAALNTPGVHAARPRYAYDISDSSPLVRGYYRARSRIPGPIRLWGAGGYATNEKGHQRFGAFPHVTADDSWFDAQFAEDEKCIANTPPVRVRTPQNAADLLRVLTRQRRGYVELGIRAETGSRGRALLSTVRGPKTAFDTLTYVALTVIARVMSRRALKRADSHAWERDGSTRTSKSLRKASQ